MTDLDGKELEIGGIYHILGSGSHVVISRYSHETSSSFVFKHVKPMNFQGEPIIYTWKRVISKLWSHGVQNKSIPVIRVSQELIDRYNIS